MSVRKRELKTIEELRSWIATGANGPVASADQGMPLYVIVRQPPKSGVADWNAVSGVPAGLNEPRWAPRLRHSINRARLLFDVR